MLSRFSVGHASQWRPLASRATALPVSTLVRVPHVPKCLNQVRGIAGGHSGAFNAAKNGGRGARSSWRVPLTALALIGGGLAVTGMGLWQFYTSNVAKFPPAIRDDLRKALYYQNYGNDPTKATEYYRSALEAALVHPDLAFDSPETTGILIQAGTLLQDLGRNREAIEVLTACFEALVHGRPLGGKLGRLEKTLVSQEDGDGQGNDGGGEAQKQQQQQQQEMGDLQQPLQALPPQQQEEETLLWHGVEDLTTAAADEQPVAETTIPKHHHAGVAHLDGPTRLKAIGVAQKLGDLHHALKQDKEAERFYVWSVEQLLRDYGPRDDQQLQQSPTKDGDNNNTLAHHQQMLQKQFDFEKLPSWMSKTDLGASLEALAGFYAKKGQYRNAVVLYRRALGLTDAASSCHASVVMCNLSDALAGMGRLDEAVQWAEKGLALGTSLSGQECDESCGVILYNLGMLNEMKGNIYKAEEYYRKSRKHGAETGFKDCVLQSNKALKRLKEGTQ